MRVVIDTNIWISFLIGKLLLEMAISGNVDYLVTGDKDLLIMNPYRGIKIITYKEFETIIGEIKRG